jgi:hypothetical protein
VCVWCVFDSTYNTMLFQRGDLTLTADLMQAAPVSKQVGNFETATNVCASTPVDAHLHTRAAASVPAELITPAPLLPVQAH